MDILEIMKKHGIAIPEDKVDDFNRDFRTSYKSSGELKKVKDDLAAAQATIQGYTDNDLEGKLKALQTKYDTDIAAKQKEIDDMSFNTRLDTALRGIEFSSDRIKQSVLSEIKNKGFKANKDGQLEGLNDYLKDLYKNEPTSFKNVDNTIHTWAGGSDNKQVDAKANPYDIFNKIH